MKKRYLRWLIPIIAAITVFFLLRQDSFLYHDPIGQVVATKTISTSTRVDEHENHDLVTQQKVTLKLLNTKDSGKTVKIKNSYSKSGAVDSKLDLHEQVFLTKYKGSYSLVDLKRDAILGALLALFIGMLIVVMKKRSILVMASLALNTIVFFVAIYLETHSSLANKTNTMPLGVFVVSLAIIFPIITSIFIVGFKKIAIIISLSSILSTGLAVMLGYGIMALTNFKGIHFEAVNYVTQVPQMLFFAQIVISSLGAILDAASDISATLTELKQDMATQFKIGMSLGRSLMGPLIAILFMIFIAGTFTESILWLRNGNPIGETVTWVMGLGFAQSLISAFGIVLAIPITSGLSALSNKRWHQK